jgi:hypothetical protein
VFPHAQPQARQPNASPGEQVTAPYRALDPAIEKFEFAALRDAIEVLAPSPPRDYFAGVLANRDGKPAESATLLERSLSWAKQSDPKRAAWALEALADDYVKAFRYSDAVRAYEDLFQHYAALLDAAQKQDDDDDFRTLQLLRDAPPQTILIEGPVALRTHRNAVLDTIETELTVNGVTASWLIDTGANFSAVSESFAQRLGVKLSEGKAQSQGITGAENQLRSAILPALHLGGAMVRHVVLIVLPDSSLNVPAGPKHRYQIQAILGYPVLRALGRFTLTRDGQFLAGPASPSSESGAPLYMYKLNPLLQCNVGNRPLIFSYDSGADRSAFSDRYFRDFQNQFHGLHKHRYGMGGAGGVRKMKVFYLPEARLGIGPVTASLRNVPTLPALGTNLSKYYGNLGRDLTDPYDRFTIDFDNMRLSLGALVEKNPK